MPIRVLDPNVIGKIAAGEVVERPASVVKEVVENSLDAGARAVDVEIVAGGCDLIRVSDDGCGIASDDLALAVQRHATSKIATTEDLGRISTLGFRGEALASIAAVSETTLTSRPAERETAHRLRVVGGTVESIQAAARAPGTTVTVEKLFFNLPARRKFLHSPASEASQIGQVLSQFALAYPEVAFRFVSDGRQSLFSPGSGNPLDASVAVLGAEVAAGLLPIEATIRFDRPSAGIAARVSGYAADPRISRSTRTGIWLFVNRRPVKSRTLSFAVEEAYETLLQVGRHPIAIVNLEVPTSDVDVNVHPAKVEVRLLHERLIYGRLRDAVRATVAVASPWGKEISSLSPALHPTTASGGADGARLIDASSPEWVAGGEPIHAGGRRLPMLRLMGQVAQTYIVAEGEQGLYLIDQHAAHERVLLERLRRSEGTEGNTQLMLEPMAVELMPAQWEMALAAGGALANLGFRLEPFGERTLLVRGIPTQLPPGEAVRALEQALQDLTEEKPAGDYRERLTLALSCRGAVKAGQTLTPEEMKSLLESLEEASITQNCSHGRPTAILLSHSQLEREFGRR